MGGLDSLLQTDKKQAFVGEGGGGLINNFKVDTSKRIIKTLANISAEEKKALIRLFGEPSKGGIM